MTRPGRRRRRTAPWWPVALVQLLPLPLVVTGDLGWTPLVGLYALEAAVVGLAHVVAGERDRGLLAALLVTVPVWLGGVAALGGGAGGGSVHPGLLAAGAGLLLGGLALTAWRGGRAAALGTTGSATTRLALIGAAWILSAVGTATVGVAPGAVASVCLVLLLAGFEALAAPDHAVAADPGQG